ncbi:NUMOD3 domain-containing DNA-binding protein [Clostridium botulinum]
MLRIGNMQVYGIIYKVTNKINKKVYIGQTTRDFNKRYPAKGIGVERIYNHNLNLKKRNINFNKHLLESMIKYGTDNFEVNIYFDAGFTKEELNIKEKLWVDFYNSFEDGYNNCEGGGNTIGYHHTEETKNKIRKTRVLRGRNDSKLNYMYGKTHTLEARRKISEVHKGKKISQQQISLLKKINKGKYNRNSKTIICLNTKEIFECMKYASSKYNIDNSELTKACKFKGRKFCGYDECGNKLLWMYIEDYNYMIRNNRTYKEMKTIIREKYIR